VAVQVVVVGAGAMGSAAAWCDSPSRRGRTASTRWLLHTADARGLYPQIGFGRVVTDYTVFSWVADIVIDSPYRGRGLGKWMMTCIAEHPLIRHTQMVLQTRDAHSLYEKYGFDRNPALMSTNVDGL